MSDNSIKIFEDDLCSNAFLKCNKTLISQNLNLFNSANSNEEKFSLLETLWEEQLKIKLVPQYCKGWETMIFPTERDKTLFLLKWQ